ncbi:MAG: TonB-dependent receptor [Lysobacterales bacterium]|jgi:hypothetical protein
MKNRLRLSFSALAVLLVLMVPATLYAQETTSSIRVTVVDGQGNPLPNITVTTLDTRTGAIRTGMTSDTGVVAQRGLPVGGPYTVKASSSQYADQTVTDINLRLGDTYTVVLQLGASTMEEVVVTSQAIGGEQLAMGPNANFGIEALETAPAINRNLTDVIRADPRIYIDESRGDINSIQCGGKNDRFNSLTLDGVRMNDSFGLNSNGYPTERMPFSYDAITQVAVEFAPFDVQYGGFSACNINAVTKSGGNEFFGSGFYDYTNDDMRGGHLQGDKIVTGPYSEKRYGVTFGGPIVKDTLFFFGAYEKLEGANLFDRGPLGSGAVNEIPISQADLAEIANISRTIYQYDPGPIPQSLGNFDEKFLLKVDWNINENHRLAFTYNYNDGNNFTESDSDNNEFEFAYHLYERGAKLDSYVANLFSDWTDNFSTEVRVSYLKLDNRQISVNGTDFGEIRVETPDVDVYLGADDSRQSNKLKYDVTSFALKGIYDLNGHILTFGLEREALDIFNLFVQHTQTEVRFDGIENFREGYPYAIYYNNAPSNNPDDAAADWGYQLNTVYGQDEFVIGDRLTVVAGLRYDWYTTSDKPAENPDFVADYGFSNSGTVDGLSLLQPRIGFTFDLSGDTSLHGGIGLYSGGNPNVWISNNYSANNVLQFGQRGRSFGYTDGSRSLFDSDIVWKACEEGVPTGPGWCIPGELYDAVAQGVGDNFEINYLDPDFKLPSEWKLALGVTHVFPQDYIFTADMLLTEGEDSAMVLHGDLEQVGTNPDGYPIYESVREPSFVLTNSSKGTRSKLFSLSLAKDYLNGFSFTVGYAYSDAEDVQPMTSSVAFSNYTNRAFFDPQEDVRSTSNYNIKHRFTFTATWRADWFGKLSSVTTLYGSANSGRPFSYTYDGTIDPYNFTPYLDFLPIVLEPGEERNSHTGSWWRKLDLRIDVGMPVFNGNNRLSAFLLIDNLTNLINDEWGVLNQYNFPRTVVRGSEEPRIGDASRYEIRVGVKFEF